MSVQQMVINNKKIEVEKLNLYYGKHHALKDINFDIAEKGVTALIGTFWLWEIHLPSYCKSYE